MSDACLSHMLHVSHVLLGKPVSIVLTNLAFALSFSHCYADWKCAQKRWMEIHVDQIAHTAEPHLNYFIWGLYILSYITLDVSQRDLLFLVWKGGATSLTNNFQCTQGHVTVVIRSTLKKCFPLWIKILFNTEFGSLTVQKDKGEPF